MNAPPAPAGTHDLERTIHMIITACTVRNFKRIREIDLDLGAADRAWILIGGNNAQGKSSLLDAIAAALGGKRAIPSDPVRHGADKAEIRIEIDGGALVVRRTIKPDGDATLTVTSEGAPVRSPQAVLDGLVGQFLDPLAFLALAPAQQRATLLTAIDTDGAIAALDQRRADVYARRRDAGRDLRRAQGELERMPIVQPVAPVALADEATNLQAAHAAMTEHRSRLTDLEDAKRRYIAATTDIDRLEAELRAARERQAAAAADGKAAKERCTALGDIAARQANIDRLQATIRNADEHNARAARAAADIERRAHVEAAVAREQATVDALATEIDEIDAAKAASLAAAKLPVDGLGVTDEWITLHGVPLDQASSAERLRFALAFAIAVGAKLGDVMIRDGALLDEHSLDLVRQQAEAAGVRVWIERVGAGDAGAIVIHDGGVR